MEDHEDLLGLNRSPYFYTCFNCQECCFDKVGKKNRNVCDPCYKKLNERVCSICQKTYYLNKYYSKEMLINNKQKRIPYDVRQTKCVYCASFE